MINWEKMKLKSEALKNFTVVIPIIIAAITSITGAYHYNDKQNVIKEAKTEKNKAIQEVVVGQQKAIDQYFVYKKETKPTVTKVYKTDCGACESLIPRIEKLEARHN